MRRSPAVLAALAVLAAVGCGETGDAPAAEPAPGAGSCRPVEDLPDDGHQHLVGDAQPPVDYGSVPPTSGWHYRDAERIDLGVRADDPLTEPEQVSVLAVGGVVVSHRGLGEEEQAALAEMVGNHADRAVLTAYDELEEGQVALTAWGVRQLCDGVDEDAVRAFVDEHAAEELDYSMSGAGAGDDAEHDH